MTRDAADHHDEGERRRDQEVQWKGVRKQERHEGEGPRGSWLLTE